MRPISVVYFVYSMCTFVVVVVVVTQTLSLSLSLSLSSIFFFSFQDDVVATHTRVFVLNYSSLNIIITFLLSFFFSQKRVVCVNQSSVFCDEKNHPV